MTAVEPTPLHEPDDYLEQQAAAEGLATAPKRQRSSAPPHDTDAELAAIGAMLLSRHATDTAIDLGLQSTDFYAPRYGAIYSGICAARADGHDPDPILVAPHLDGISAADLVAIMAEGGTPSRMAGYVARITNCAHSRRLQGLALDVAQAAQANELDEALRRLTALTDAVPTEIAEHGWAPHDLTTILNDEPAAPAPTVLAVDGGPGMFYEGRTNMIFGEGGSGKTWVALQAVAEAIVTGRSVIYIDLEDTAAGLIARLLALGVTRDQLARHLLYVQPEQAWGPTAQAALAALCDRHDIALVVFDSTGEAMAADGVKGNDDDDVARWFTAGPKYLARRGPTVLVIDHIPKDNQHAPLDPIGSQRKKAAIDGACYRIDAPKPPTIDRDGLLVAVVSKDRHGHRQRGSKAIEIAVTHPHPGLVELAARAATGTSTGPDGTFRPTTVMERVSRFLEDNPGQSGHAIESTVAGRAKVIREATRLLIVERYIEQDPTARGFSYRSVRPFRADADPVDNADVEAEPHAS